MSPGLTLEQKRRVQQIVEKISQPRRLLERRGVEVLEHIGSTAAGACCKG